MTIMSFSVVEYFAPQLEVKAMRKALDTTPQKLTNSKIWNHMPVGTAQRNRIYAEQQKSVILNYLTFTINEVFLVPSLEFLVPSLEFLVPSLEVWNFLYPVWNFLYPVWNFSYLVWKFGISCTQLGISCTQFGISRIETTKQYSLPAASVILK